jgi:hypothetical protein
MFKMEIIRAMVIPIVLLREHLVDESEFRLYFFRAPRIEETHNIPSANTTMIDAFVEFGNCRGNIVGTGKAIMSTSENISTTATAANAAFWLSQCPDGSFKFQL